MYLKELKNTKYNNTILASTSGGSASSSSNTIQKTLDPRINVISTDKFTEKCVSDLVKLGFGRDKVIAELRYFNGDKNQATASLFAKSLKF